MKTIIKVAAGVGIIYVGQIISPTFHCGVVTGVLMMGAYMIIDFIAERL